MRKQGRVSADDPSEPHPCPLGPGPEPLVLVAAPADQVGVYPPQGAAESRPIEVAVVVDPALDVRIEHPCQILQGLVASSVECPPTNRLPYCLQRLWTSRGQERDTELTPAPDSRPRTKLVSEKVERLDRIISLTVSIPAVDELRLLRMQNQPAGPETALQGAPHLSRHPIRTICGRPHLPLSKCRASSGSSPSTCRGRSAG